MRLGAALDGELDAANALAFERELAEDAALAAEFRRLEKLRDAMRRHAPREAAPEALRARILALADGGEPAKVEPAKVENVVPLQPRRPAPLQPRRPARLPNWLPLAASFAVLGFAAGAGLTSLRTPSASQALGETLVADYARAAIAGQPFDVASSDRHTVKPWLSGRTTVSADIVDLSAQGFPLAGGRVAVVDRIPAPTLIYRHNEHMVAVTELPPDAKGAAGPSAIQTIDGYHIARWSDDKLAYVAVSDMDEKTLGEFVAAFKEARKPAAEERRP